MREYVVIAVPQDLLPQVTGEVLSFAADANLVEVVHEGAGQVLHVHPEVAEAWFQARKKVESESEAEPGPLPEPAPEPESPAVEVPAAPQPTEPVAAASVTTAPKPTAVPKKTTSA